MAPTPEPPISITLKVKVPPGYITSNDPATPSADEFLLGAVSVSANIGSVRQRIQQLVPFHPSPELQRLLYGGRALVDNEQSVADALNTKRDPTQTEYVIHLLVRGEGVGGGRSGETNNGLAQRAGTRTPTPSIHPAQHVEQGSVPNVLPGGADPHLQAQQNAHRLHHENIVRQFQRQNMARLPFGNGVPIQHQQAFHQNAVAGTPQQWQQFVAQQQQQQRAALGTQGISTQQMVNNLQSPSGETGLNPPQTDTPSERQADSSLMTSEQDSHVQNQTGTNEGTQNAGQFPQAGPTRRISGQGFHLQGVGPHGERVHIHQQMFHGPFMGTAGMPQHPSFSGMLGGTQPNLPGPTFPRHQAQQQALDRTMTALERSRRDILEMRRTLNDLRTETGISEEQRARIDETQARVDRLGDYIDPLRLGATQTGASSRAATQSANLNLTAARDALASIQPLSQPQVHTHRTPNPNQPSHNDVTCYLLSSPQGPQALLFSPQHGAFNGSLSRQFNPAFYHQHVNRLTTPIVPLAQTPNHQPRDPVEIAVHEQVQAVAAEQAQAAALAQQPLGPFQPLFGHLWLLLRVLIFAYFLLGSNMGWQRPLILAGIGIAFWILRTGFLREGAPLRRWWEGIVAAPQDAQVNMPANQGQQNNAANGQAQQVANAPNVPANAQQQAGARRAVHMPTPEQVAQRLLDEDNARRRAHGGWLREQVRPVERVLALFLASLWPGVGEAHVRAQEQEQQRRRQEEADRQASEEAERQVNEEREKNEKEEDPLSKSAEGSGEQSSAGATRAIDAQSVHVDGPSNAA